jgi:hypothetical protein
MNIHMFECNVNSRESRMFMQMFDSHYHMTTRHVIMCDRRSRKIIPMNNERRTSSFPYREQHAITVTD